ncbi:glutamyl-tRNA reductase [Glutamicibacter sp. MNS18]|uniref:glutamyl-tRNA reductase n=1 Tax=Glutamicibacter sp. MNS18 TaxID=2989817 RepID=UPI002235F676|nr:glutamyl-tRNA reductase [Glutamicibacter sp. MNS18]MCW4464347.1 glutamyl-tRNA reductase [Glutamicibacter sp. MNS18]
MVYLSLVASHSQLDLETVAHLSASAGELATASLKSASLSVNGTVVLATCNRFEVYADVTSPLTAATELVEQLADTSGIPAHLLESKLLRFEGRAVIDHLFSVGAGLESAVVGEREIAGQVRRALAEAQTQKTTTGNLTRLFETATRTAKDVGSQTALGSQGKSVVSVALDLADDLMSASRDWSEQEVVLFGTGAYAGATLALLRERGVRHIKVYSTSGRAEDFASKRDVSPIAEGELDQALRQADVIIGCSGNGTTLTRERLTTLRVRNHPLIAIDMALTHDFDPRLAELPDVELITLESVRMAAPDEQALAVYEAKKIVARSADEFDALQREREADHAIVALRRHTQQVLEAEVAKVRSQHGCTSAADEVELAMRRMMRQLLHVPTVRARELAAQGRAGDYISALETMYGLEVSTPAPARQTAADPEKKAPAPASCPMDLDSRSA